MRATQSNLGCSLIWGHAMSQLINPIIIVHTLIESNRSVPRMFIIIRAFELNDYCDCTSLTPVATSTLRVLSQSILHHIQLLLLRVYDYCSSH